MFKKLFGKKDKVANTLPSILGLRIGCSFELDPLMLKLLEGHLVIENSAVSHVIQAAGIVQLDDTYIFRFYTDDDAFLQVVSQGGKSDDQVVDVKLYHYFDTLDVSQDSAWDKLLYKEIGQTSYQLAEHHYQRVWESVTDYHQPIHMQEKTYDESGECDVTDQFTMLFERDVAGDKTESLFLSAEEKENDHGGLDRCFVMSTGITLSSTHITIHG